jgi:hypothetical protein
MMFRFKARVINNCIPVEETGIHRENHRPSRSDEVYLVLNNEILEK